MKKEVNSKGKNIPEDFYMISLIAIRRIFFVTSS